MSYEGVTLSVFGDKTDVCKCNMERLRVIQQEASPAPPDFNRCVPFMTICSDCWPDYYEANKERLDADVEEFWQQMNDEREKLQAEAERLIAKAQKREGDE